MKNQKSRLLLSLILCMAVAFTVFGAVACGPKTPLDLVINETEATFSIDDQTTYTLNYTVSGEDSLTITGDNEANWTREGDVVTFTAPGTYTFTILATQGDEQKRGNVVVTVTRDVRPALVMDVTEYLYDRRDGALRLNYVVTPAEAVVTVDTGSYTGITFADGSLSCEESGEYTLTLVATFGEYTDSQTFTVRSYYSPSIDLTQNEYEVDLTNPTVTVTYTTTPSTASVIYYYDNDAGITVEGDTLTFSKAGVFEVQAVARNDGWQASKTFTVTVVDSTPIITMNTTSYSLDLAAGSVVTLDYAVAPSSSTVSVDLTGYTGVTYANGKLTFTKAGTYNLKLVAVNKGVTSEQAFTVTVYESPVLTMTTTGYDVDLRNNTLDLSGFFSFTPSTATARIDLGSYTGVTANGTTLTFTKSGTYNLALVVENDGHSARKNFTVTVYHSPEIQMNVTNYTVNLSEGSVTLDYTVDPATAEVTVDTTGYTGITVNGKTLTFTKGGTYSLKLVAENDDYTDEATFTVTVIEAPVITMGTAFEHNIANGAMALEYTVAPSAAEISLDAGSHTGVTLADGKLTFTQAGEYNLTLVATYQGETTEHVFTVSVYNRVKLEGQGTEQSPLLVKSGADLEKIGACVLMMDDLAGLYFKQTQNIDLSAYANWSPIGSLDLPFAGNFDGAGFDILNLNINSDAAYVGLFGYVTGTVKNVTIASGLITATKTEGVAVGAIAGAAGATAQIIDCENNAALNAVICVGGIVGNLSGTATGCVNNGAIDATKSTVGGIAGESTGVVVGCTNNGILGGDASTAYWIGGIVGYKTDGTITDCHNTGAIVTAFGSDTTNSSVGGIVGYNVKGNIADCTNEAVVTAVRSVGGIAGRFDLGVLSNCENKANAVITANINAGGMAGILGNGSYDATVYADTCVNRGTVIALTRNAGGIAGYDYVDVKNCTNYGTIGKTESTSYYLGGIVGQKASGTVDGCINEGAIIAGHANSVSGGIVGENLAGGITNCTNKGTVTGQTIVGGIVGRAKLPSQRVDDADVIIEGSAYSVANCVNEATATVTGVTNMGGIVGRIEGHSLAEHVTVSGCKNYAAVTATGKADEYGFVGGIVGMHGTQNVVTGCENYGNVDGGVIAVAEEGATQISSNGVGGISGAIYTNSQIINSKNGGQVKGSSVVGGIVGNIVRSDSKVEGCQNLDTALILAEFSLGGIAGKQTSGTVKDCSNAGQVGNGTETAYYVAGIVGAKSAGVISGSTNSGAIYGKSSGNSCLGGIVGDHAAGEVTDCHNTGALVNTINITGGIVGRLKGGVVSDCTNAGALRGNSQVGGIVGLKSAGDVTDCENLVAGTINGTSTGSSLSGGIVGDNTSGNVTNCVNNAPITANGDYTGGIVGRSVLGTLSELTNNGVVASADVYVGGIVGYLEAGTLTQSTNTAKVEGTHANAKYVGGLVGQVGKKGTAPEITNSHNTGSIIGISSSIGGLFGFHKSGSAVDCTNAGTVTGKTQVGGIAGYMSASGDQAFATLANCDNLATGAVTAENSVAGIVGYFAGVSGGTLTGCDNAASVTASVAGYAGGIVAMAGSNVVISACNNSGAVKGVGYLLKDTKYGVGGIVGSLFKATLENCVNTGAVESAQYVGGIVGIAAHAGGKILNCTNNGVVTTTAASGAAHAGGIVGYNEATTVTGNVNNVAVVAASGVTSVGSIYGSSAETIDASANTDGTAQ